MTTHSKELIESLLLEEESATLDFKQAQYPFRNATDEQKSELLKDILAFTNAFRRSDAYILVGVQEVRGGRSNVVGISEHIGDADLQQFVNSKTQRPVTFSYKAAEHDGKQIAVLHIPMQFRPVYAKADFGKVKKDVVYLRRGSSTATANPEEIAQMGAERSVVEAAAPSLEVMLFDRSAGKPIGTETELHTVLLGVPDKKDIPDYRRSRTEFVMGVGENSNYYRELVEFTARRNFLTSMSLAIRNSGSATAHDVRLVFEVNDPDNAYEFVEEWDFPEPPETQSSVLHGMNFRTVHDVRDVMVARLGDTWRMTCLFSKIQPHATATLANELYVGSRRSGRLGVDAQVFADNLSKPITAHFDLVFHVTSCDISMDEIEDMEYERFSNTPEGRRLLQEGDEEN